MPKEKERFIFLDRDGVINKRRKDYVKCWEEFEVLKNVKKALNKLTASGFKIIIITNQSAFNLSS